MFFNFAITCVFCVLVIALSHGCFCAFFCLLCYAFHFTLFCCFYCICVCIPFFKLFGILYFSRGSMGNNLSISTRKGVRPECTSPDSTTHGMLLSYIRCFPRIEPIPKIMFCLWKDCSLKLSKLTETRMHMQS